MRTYLLTILTLATCLGAIKTYANSTNFSAEYTVNFRPRELRSSIRQVTESNNLQHVYSQMEKRIQHLPNQGKIAKQLWSDTYWPFHKGGISHRWTVNQTPWDYKSPNSIEFQNMPRQEREKLSPAEKYDIITNSWDYNLKQYTLKETAPNQPTWFGICEGWASASIQYGQASPVDVTLPDGSILPISASDIHALLSYASSLSIRKFPAPVVGNRCYQISPQGVRTECDGVNPASLHLVLANHIGVLKQSFIADVERREEVWNHPVDAYSSAIEITQHQQWQRPGLFAYRATTQMRYAIETLPQWLPGSVQMSVANYDYILYTDNAGTIVDGVWISEKRPDFLWFPNNIQLEKAQYWGALNQIYQASQPQQTMGTRP